ncbi:hypothetical protein ASG75_03880 [Rhodanobacter sp. Soil772]|uniref:DUF748 domain-containing protein n=1 Tax=Rhodanobacter sp. Soil772 TaxID=1736406 RepID=UPI0006FB3F80|nr:DUF748 domain-containing protein [Rhodanobacter sp. Soil772]KRE87286.1 hypothetical protein ASG75_03880 [Rhodanobacter sp. Soil772]
MSGSSLSRLRVSLRAAWGSARTHAQTLSHSPRARRFAAIAAAVLLIYALLGFLAAPPLLRNYLQNHSAEMLGRPLSLGQVRFNPFTLNLRIRQLHLPDTDGKTPFVDIDQLTLNASWGSLFRLAPVLDELRLDQPRIAITRGKDQRFNFTDLIERFTAKPSPADNQPARFSLSNISVHGGDIRFDDRLLGAQHHVEKLELGIPFLANLPSSTDIFVQPLLAMTVDGSPLRIDGQTKPFASNRESTIGFQLDRLDLPRYLAYVPTAMPVAIPKGLLSGKLSLHFVQTQPTPQLQLTGNLQLDDFALDSNRGETIARLGHGDIELTDVQPLASRYHLGAMKLERAALFYTQHAGGHSNFDSLMPPPTKADDKTPPTDLRIAVLTLQNSTLSYTDANQAKLQLTQLHGSLLGLGTLAGPPAKLDLASQLAGGNLNVRGAVDLAASHYAGALELKQVALVPLQALAASATATRIAKGKLDASGQLRLDWGKAFNLHIEPAQLGISDFALEPQAKGLPAPVAWRKLDAGITRLDLATRNAQLDKVTAHGLQVDAVRERDDRINLTSLFAGKHAAPASHDEGPAWRWSIAHLGLEQGSLRLTDRSIESAKPTSLLIDALNGSIDELSDKLDRSSRVKLEGRIGKGSFATAGTLQPLPTVADLQLTTKRLDIAGFVPYASVPLNVDVTSARLSSDGKLHYDGRRSEPRFDYAGNAAFERVRMQDKLTGDDFMRWRSLSGSRIDLRYGNGTPRVHLGGLVLDAFYARVIVNSNGRLNLSDVIANGEQAPVSVTRAANNAPAAPQPVSSAPTAPAADIHIGEVTLANGQLNYTDNFIKPNYTANLTSLTGRIGAFGTTAGEPPAELVAQAKLDDASPVDISGSINPLLPVAFLDIKGKATDVELTRLSTYSGKYTGYPITKGKLTADVHYLLDQGKLNADNHIFITQLTFGERMDGPGVSHLPVKLAVALLKDTEGNIDVNVPVSGSLDDPQFSLGGMIMRAFGNLIAKAATAPFRLLASAFGGGHEDLGYVEFAPGSAVLDGPAKDRLGQIVQMLGRKPALTLDISGRVDPSLDEAGLRKVTVDDQIRREKLTKESGDKIAADASATTLAEVTVTPDEHERYLRRAYRHADFEKPKNALGLSKSLEPDEMRSLLETHVNADAAAMRALAERRAAAVQDWLHGKLDDKRIAIKPPKLDASGINDKGKSTRADFGLH